MPRMADFARILAAVDQILGTDGLERYASRAGSIAMDALTADLFIQAMSMQLNEAFEGTAAELLKVILHGEQRAPKGWPANARAVTTLLKRQAPLMRRAGWTVNDLGMDGLSGERDTHGITRWKIIRPEKAGISSPPSPPSPPESDLGGEAGNAGHENGPSPGDITPAASNLAPFGAMCRRCGKVTYESAADGHPEHYACGRAA